MGQQGAKQVAVSVFIILLYLEYKYVHTLAQIILIESMFICILMMSHYSD
jgi:hypothetical protein